METKSKVTLWHWSGSLIAGLMSWYKWHSIFMALIHGLLCGWIYVIYYLIRYGKPSF